MQARRVEGECIDGARERIGTKLTFEFAETDGEIAVRFSQRAGSSPSSSCTPCSTKWAMSLLRGKALIEKGAWHTAPHDPKVSCWFSPLPQASLPSRRPLESSRTTPSRKVPLGPSRSAAAFAQANTHDVTCSFCDVTQRWIAGRLFDDAVAESWAVKMIEAFSSHRFLRWKSTRPAENVRRSQMVVPVLPYGYRYSVGCSDDLTPHRKETARS